MQSEQTNKNYQQAQNCWRFQNSESTYSKPKYQYVYILQDTVQANSSLQQCIIKDTQNLRHNKIDGLLHIEM